MGQEIEKTRFSEEDYQQFKKHLKQETTQLDEYFNNGELSNHGLMGGFEIESWLLNHALQAAPINKEFLAAFDSSLATAELAKFNLEFNNLPRELSGSVFSNFHAELTNTWERAVKVAKNLDPPASLLMIGTLPTLALADLNENSMSDMNRYRALNNEIMERRKKKPLHLSIHGEETLDLYSHDVMLEASTTSFQIHTKVPAPDAHHYYNASLLLSAPIVAVAANSPYVFGKNLWHETRIPLFEQSIDTNNPKAPCKRVSFGTGYAQQSILECFHENTQNFHILLPIVEEHDNTMAHLRLHNGTVWRWNRPLVGFDDDETPHIRIEHRAIPAGPTLFDMIANAVFFYGLQHYWAQQLKQGQSLPDFKETRKNFYTCAMHGFKQPLRWFGNEVKPDELVLTNLLNQAKHGLKDLAIDQSDINKYLEVIEARVKNKQTGAQWQRNYIHAHHCDMAELTHAYQCLQQTDEPVHTWEIKRNDTLIRKQPALFTLKQIDRYPDELLKIDVEQLYTLFPSPTLLHLPGKSSETLFISILLHGNESTGFYVVQELLKKYHNDELPKSISIFFGNTQAARYGLRFLDQQPDYNRIWPGTMQQDFAEIRIMQDIVNEMRNRNLFASVDIHNNTGLNPHYACINKLENHFLHLASLFDPTVVYFLTPKGVQSQAFSELCPAVTLECGKVQSKSGISHALNYLETLLHIDAIPDDDVDIKNIHLFHTLARIEVPENVSFSFSDSSADILFLENLDKINFKEMPIGTCLGYTRSDADTRLLAFEDNDMDIADSLFAIENNQILLKKSLMPAMLTLDETIIRQDCLCYLMERIPYTGKRPIIVS